ncbi:probable U3 small nucleolar RNA-associated protein 11 [Octopus sinensis]|uniref:Probable U3 small nucleolar RNA-associated protein 11 n=1 Tax=Octopus sinensis TaxID=2607531 RepID=A0A7E6EHA0_9MOLL|nr:probable U3 small nucleolar RNA-associated protein 11 [Octopus sinensis]
MSFAKSQKSGRKKYKERSQPTERAQLGILEKRADYRVRAKNANEKRDQLRQLHLKALDRNPDEFHFKMMRTKLIVFSLPNWRTEFTSRRKTSPLCTQTTNDWPWTLRT